MSTTLSYAPTTAPDQAVVASYSNHADVEAAVRLLAESGLPPTKISIIGRNFETHEDIQGFYRPADAARDGAGEGAWYGGLFGLMIGAMGFFIFPVIGGLMIIGPVAGFVAGAIGGAGVGALISGLGASGIPRNQALKYQERLEAGEFLVVLHGTPEETTRAHKLLHETTTTSLMTHDSTDALIAPAGSV